jgi:hypothetical protein
MTIEEGLKSDDIEILALYCNIALEKYHKSIVSKMINKQYMLIPEINNDLTLCKIGFYLVKNDFDKKYKIKLNHKINEPIRTNTIR